MSGSGEHVTTSSSVLFRQQPKDIQLTVIELKKRRKYSPLGDCNQNILTKKSPQNQYTVSKWLQNNFIADNLKL